MLGTVPRQTGDDVDEPAAAIEELLSRTAQRRPGRRSPTLYDRPRPRILGLIRHVLIDPAQSEEVAQEVFLEIWQSATRFDPNKGRALTWIMTMAHRRAVDRVRAAQTSRDRDTAAGLRDLPTAYDDVAETVEVRVEHERVEVAMSKLSDNQRQALLLAYFGGLSQSEVAEQLGIPLGTAKTRLARWDDTATRRAGGEELTDDSRSTPGASATSSVRTTTSKPQEFEEVAAQLGLAARPVTPPASLKADLFAKLDSDGAAARHRCAAARARAETKARRRWFTRPAAALAAAAAAIVLFVGGVFVGSALTGGTRHRAAAGVRARRDQRGTGCAARERGGRGRWNRDPRLVGGPRQVRSRRHRPPRPPGRQDVRALVPARRHGRSRPAR